MGGWCGVCNIGNGYYSGSRNVRWNLVIEQLALHRNFYQTVMTKVPAGKLLISFQSSTYFLLSILRFVFVRNVRTIVAFGNCSVKFRRHLLFASINWVFRSPLQWVTVLLFVFVVLCKNWISRREQNELFMKKKSRVLHNEKNRMNEDIRSCSKCENIICECQMPPIFRNDSTEMQQFLMNTQWRNIAIMYCIFFVCLLVQRLALWIKNAAQTSHRLVEPQSNAK